MNSGEPPKEKPPVIPGSQPASITSDDGGAANNTQAEIRKELGEFERISIQIQRRMLWVTVIVAIVTGAYVAISYLMYRVMDDQLADSSASSADQQVATLRAYGLIKQQAGQMKTLAEQTTTLAQQTESLATSVSKFPDFAEKSIAVTEQLAGATSRAAVASQRLANAASDANKVSRELVAATQQAGGINRNVARAYVFATDIKINPIMSPMPPYKPISWTANIAWDNTGNTPTNGLVISANCWSAGLGAPMVGVGPVVNGQQPDAFDVSTIKPGDKSLLRIPDAPHLIGPKSTKHSVGCVIGTIEAVFNGIGGLLNFYYYSFGTARYKDVFGAPHRTDFCFVMRLTGNGEVNYMDEATAAKEGLKPLGIEAGFCQKHNCADEECDADPLQPTTPPEPAKPPA